MMPALASIQSLCAFLFRLLSYCLWRVKINGYEWTEIVWGTHSRNLPGAYAWRESKETMSDGLRNTSEAQRMWNTKSFENNAAHNESMDARAKQLLCYLRCLFTFSGLCSGFTPHHLNRRWFRIVNKFFPANVSWNVLLNFSRKTIIGDVYKFVIPGV